MCFLFNVKKLAVASLNHAEQLGAIQFLYYHILYKQNEKFNTVHSLPR